MRIKSFETDKYETLIFKPWKVGAIEGAMTYELKSRLDFLDNIVKSILQEREFIEYILKGRKEL